jgi:hypothetical protein
MVEFGTRDLLFWRDSLDQVHRCERVDLHQAFFQFFTGCGRNVPPNGKIFEGTGLIATCSVCSASQTNATDLPLVPAE